MNKKEYLITKVAEESSELAQSMIKLLHFGAEERYQGGSSNLERAADEFNDLLGVVEMLHEEFGLTLKVSRDKIKAKKEKVNKYYEISKQLLSEEK